LRARGAQHNKKEAGQEKDAKGGVFYRVCGKGVEKMDK
jgi:hypothetical protein